MKKLIFGIAILMMAISCLDEIKEQAAPRPDNHRVVTEVKHISDVANNSHDSLRIISKVQSDINAILLQYVICEDGEIKFSMSPEVALTLGIPQMVYDPYCEKYNN